MFSTKEMLQKQTQQEQKKNDAKEALPTTAVAQQASVNQYESTDSLESRIQALEVEQNKIIENLKNTKAELQAMTARNLKKVSQEMKEVYKEVITPLMLQLKKKIDDIKAGERYVTIALDSASLKYSDRIYLGHKAINKPITDEKAWEILKENIFRECHNSINNELLKKWFENKYLAPEEEGMDPADRRSTVDVYCAFSEKFLEIRMTPFKSEKIEELRQFFANFIKKDSFEITCGEKGKLMGRYHNDDRNKPYVFVTINQNQHANLVKGLLLSQYAGPVPSSGDNDDNYPRYKC